MFKIIYVLSVSNPGFYSKSEVKIIPVLKLSQILPAFYGVKIKLQNKVTLPSGNNMTPIIVTLTV